MLVRAIKDSFVNGGRRRAGAVFDYTVPKGGELPKFLEQVNDPVPEEEIHPEILPPKVPGQAPSTGAQPDKETPVSASVPGDDKDVDFLS